MRLAGDFRYEQLASDIEARIRNGTYRPGERLPSLRRLHNQLQWSVSTIHQAYVRLESLGLVEARPKSGYYVSPGPWAGFRAPTIRRVASAPQEVELSAMVKAVVAAINDPALLPLGSSTTSPDLLPYRHFARIIKSLSASDLKGLTPYALTEGSRELRRQIAQRTMGLVGRVEPEDVVVTNGCLEAVSLCLLAVVRPGETVVLESPTFFAFLQLLKELGVLVIEAPTDPETGIDVGELARLIGRHRVKACLLAPNFQNPLGALMPDDNKEELVDLLGRHEIPLIEDDISAELFFEGGRPRPAKAFDKKGLVMTCSSFSKTLAPGLRVGWVLPGPRFKERILNLKAGLSVSSSSLGQALAARYLSSGAFERHIRTLRDRIKKQTMQTALAIRKYFPGDVRLALPRGGALLWLELNEKVDGLEVYRRAFEEKISILPGGACSGSGNYNNCIRLGCGFPFTAETEKGIATLGDIVGDIYARVGAV
ncbi:MAG: PLP-dependent aminotransferase family protein [Pseudomonadota bacterium]